MIHLQQGIFDGADYKPGRDDVRLTGQLERIYSVMRDGMWRSLPAIENETGAPQASISAQLRNLRKARFGGHRVDKEYIGTGVYLYRLVVNKSADRGIR